MSELTMARPLFAEEELQHNREIPGKYRALLRRVKEASDIAVMEPVREPEIAPEPFESTAEIFETPATEVFESPAPETFAAPPKEAASPADSAPSVTVDPGYYAPTAELISAAPTSSDEDAVPTSRTMDTLRRFAASVRAFFAALTPKMKVGLAAVSVAIVLTFTGAIVCSREISKLNARIATKELELDRVAREARQIESRIEDVMDDDTIDAWAESEGWIKNQG